MEEDLCTPEFFHRKVPHNTNEINLVRESKEVWGREAKVLAWDVAVKAYPGYATQQNSYTFKTGAMPKLKYGFIGKKRVVRELVWILGMEGVEERENGDAAVIKVGWFEEWKG